MNKKLIKILAISICIISIAFCFVACNNVDNDNKTVVGGEGAGSGNLDGNSDSKPLYNGQDSAVWVSIYHNAKFQSKLQQQRNTQFCITPHLKGKELSKVTDTQGNDIAIIDGKIKVDNSDIFIFLMDKLQSFAITTETDKYCKIVVQSQGVVGEKVVFNTSVNSNYYKQSMTICCDNGNLIVSEYEGSNAYSFTMPTCAVKITLVAAKNEFSISTANISNPMSTFVAIKCCNSSKFGEEVVGSIQLSQGWSLSNLKFYNARRQALTAEQIKTLRFKVLDTNGEKDIANICDGDKISFVMPTYDIAIEYEQKQIAYDLTIINDGASGVATSKLSKFCGEKYSFVVANAAQGYAFSKIIVYNADDISKAPLPIDIFFNNGATSGGSGDSVSFEMIAANIVVEVVFQKINFLVQKEIVGCGNGNVLADGFLQIDKTTYNFGDIVNIVVNVSGGYVFEEISAVASVNGEAIILTKNAVSGQYELTMPCSDIVIKLVVWNSLQSVWQNMLDHIGNKSDTSATIKSESLIATELKKASIFDNFNKEIPIFAAPLSTYDIAVQISEIPRNILGKDAKDMYAYILTIYNDITSFFAQEQFAIALNAFELACANAQTAESSIVCKATNGQSYTYTFYTSANFLKMKISWTTVAGVAKEVVVSDTIQEVLQGAKHIITRSDCIVECRGDINVDSDCWDIVMSKSYPVDGANDNNCDIKYANTVLNNGINSGKKTPTIDLNIRPNNCEAQRGQNGNNVKVLTSAKAYSMSRQPYVADDAWKEIDKSKTVIKVRDIESGEQVTLANIFQNSDKWHVREELNSCGQIRYCRDDRDGANSGFIVPLAITNNLLLDKMFYYDGATYVINDTAVDSITTTGLDVLCGIVFANAFALRWDGEKIAFAQLTVPMVWIDCGNVSIDIARVGKGNYDNFISSNAAFSF